MSVTAANFDAEESVLGAILSAGALGPEPGHRIVDRVLATGLLPSDFYIESSGRLFALLVAMRLRDLPLDAVSVADELGRRGGEPHARGRLERLAYVVTAFSNVEHHARIVGRHARHRREVPDPA